VPAKELQSTMKPGHDHQFIADGAVDGPIMMGNSWSRALGMVLGRGSSLIG